MTEKQIHVVTGAFGYTGQYIARRLLARGYEVRTLTNSATRDNPFKGEVKAYPYSFDDRERLIASLEGAGVVYNTYWVRFDHRDLTHTAAVKNSLVLFDAALQAGVNRFIHISITNPSHEFDLPYFRGKAELETALIKSGLPYAILRPTVLFGKEDILVNNIAWVLLHLPVFGVFGDGRYRVHPIYVDDLAQLAVEVGLSSENVVVDAIGPETFTYRELIKTIADGIGHHRPIISVPPTLGLAAAKVLGLLVKDVVVTREEIRGLMENRLYTDSRPAGTTRFSVWVKENGHQLGTRYTSELARRRDRQASYNMLRNK